MYWRACCPASRRRTTTPKNEEIARFRVEIAQIPAIFAHKTEILERFAEIVYAKTEIFQPPQEKDMKLIFDIDKEDISALVVL